MTTERRVDVRASVLLLAGATLLAAGVGAGYVAFAPQYSPTPAPSPSPVAVAPSAPAVASASTAIVVPMTRDARRRAGLVLTPVASAVVGGSLRVPGVVEANAYRRVAVTPVAAGRVTRVGPQLGDHVVRGQTIAEIYSPELAEAQANYVSARAGLEAHDRELARMEKLVQLGSASRQELERVVAEHTARRTAVQSGASRLTLFGVTEKAIERLAAGHTAGGATLAVPAPLSGVVTERPANVGVTVDSATPLATIVDLSTVWVMADVYEKDAGRVRVGMPATITTTALPERALDGKVTFIDPQVNVATRTARVRIEVANRRQELRLGMLADVRIEASAGQSPTIAIPRTAVQSLFDRSVVYVVNPANDGEFVERTVRLGDAAGDKVAVLAGLDPDDVVVAEGSFHVRAERERLGLGEPAPTPVVPSRSAVERDTTAVQTATVTVTKDGFSPATLTLRAGSRARLTFVRTTNETCATDVAVPSLKITRALPLNQPVAVEFAPAKAGTIEFACGMGMFKGAIVIE